MEEGSVPFTNLSTEENITALKISIFFPKDRFQLDEKNKVTMSLVSDLISNYGVTARTVSNQNL